MSIFNEPLEGNWVVIEEFPNYAISDDGRVANRSTNLLRSQSYNPTGAPMVTLMHEGFRATRSVVVLVANAFLSREGIIDFWDTPIHLNGDRSDCRVQNLAWRPRWFAVMYHKQFSPGNGFGPGMLIPGIFIEQTEEIFEDSFDAAVKYGMLNSDIVLALQNEERSSFPYNFTFKYVWGDERDTFLD